MKSRGIHTLSLVGKAGVQFGYGLFGESLIGGWPEAIGK